jgi:hypothetical protein
LRPLIAALDTVYCIVARFDCHVTVQYGAVVDAVLMVMVQVVGLPVPIGT